MKSRRVLEWKLTGIKNETRENRFRFSLVLFGMVSSFEVFLVICLWKDHSYLFYFIGYLIDEVIQGPCFVKKGGLEENG